MSSRSKSRTGFTLVELLVVIAIIGVFWWGCFCQPSKQHAKLPVA